MVADGGVRGGRVRGGRVEVDTVAEAAIDARLAADFEASARTSMPRAPLYAALSAGIARRPGLYRLLLHAPPEQRLPVLLLACIHDLLLAQPRDDLAAWYPNLTPEPRDPTDPALVVSLERFVDAHRRALVELLGTRATQTNEVGRCALLLPAFGLLHDEVGPLAHIDVGASGGLNLLLDRFRYVYTAAGGEVTTVGAPSSVELAIATTGAVPIPDVVPVIVERCGLDREPIDVADDREARWLQACVWPDQPERFHRLRAAVDLARRQHIRIVRGDAVSSLASTIEETARVGHAVVTNSWVLNYLTADQRVAYLAELDRIGTIRDLSWVYAEAPALISELPTGPDPDDPHLTVLSMVRWRGGVRRVDHLATCHPHGFWIHWR